MSNALCQHSHAPLFRASLTVCRNLRPQTLARDTMMSCTLSCGSLSMPAGVLMGVTCRWCMASQPISHCCMRVIALHCTAWAGSRPTLMGDARFPVRCYNAAVSRLMLIHCTRTKNGSSSTQSEMHRHLNRRWPTSAMVMSAFGSSSSATDCIAIFPSLLVKLSSVPATNSRPSTMAGC